MKITFTKDSFGPFSISATLEVDPKAKVNVGSEEAPDMVTTQEKYLRLGALYEAERTPSSKAEKLFWTETDPKTGKLVRGKTFTRAQNIPGTLEAAESIKASFEASGYQDVLVELREVKQAGPAWKTKVAGLVGGIELGLDVTSVKEAIAALIKRDSLDQAEVSAFAKSKGLVL